jgi:hypothetical protein
VTRKEN